MVNKEINKRKNRKGYNNGRGKMESVSKIEIKFNTERSKKTQFSKRLISELNKFLSKPQFKDGEIVSIKELR